MHMDTGGQRCIMYKDAHTKTCTWALEDNLDVHKDVQATASTWVLEDNFVESDFSSIFIWLSEISEIELCLPDLYTRCLNLLSHLTSPTKKVFSTDYRKVKLQISLKYTLMLSLLLIKN